MARWEREHDTRPYRTSWQQQQDRQKEFSKLPKSERLRQARNASRYFKTDARAMRIARALAQKREWKRKYDNYNYKKQKRLQEVKRKKKYWERERAIQDYKRKLEEINSDDEDAMELTEQGYEGEELERLGKIRKLERIQKRSMDQFYEDRATKARHQEADEFTNALFTPLPDSDDEDYQNIL